ncbi:TonB-dependent receptor [Catenovulum sediminis]|uniref:TonB-dependent receptor plug domain-containing protein n=1 Tax=Catenovulum sediminis TaxID=1740262 RepID=A0ABV1RFV5_9ALTE|nr:TonB-dependent receptor plug domain-containing protein [Catenovulum sediminis]
MRKLNKVSLAVKNVLIASSMAAVASPLLAQDSEAEVNEVAQSKEAFETIVVTGSPGGRTQIESAMAVTSVDSEMIKDFQPSSESEVFRMIPGIQVAGTAGPGGNSNIAVRGLPVATGGSPFVQIQEDGLPTVLFGDIQFGNNDYWTRFDSSVERVEGVRGGTAGTFASQAPGAIINYISNYGQFDGGLVKLTTGVGYDETKVDFRYGGAASGSVNYHVGGFYKKGRGPLDAGYVVSDSMQLKANLTKYLADDASYIRFLFKVADTQEPNYTGSPALAKASKNADGSYNISDIREYPGFDGRDKSNYSIYNQNFKVVNRQGDLERVPLSGISTKSVAIGTELHYEFEDEIILDNKMRWTSMSGSFNSSFLSLNPVGDLNLVYANGPKTGQAYDKPYYDGNVNVNTNISDIGSFVNDLTLTKEFYVDGNTLSVRGGLFYMTQDIAQDWHPNRAYKELSGDNPAMLELLDDNGNQLTANGIAGYSDAWGNCCAREVDLAYTDTAPYISLDLDTDMFTVDASVRRDTVKASGWAVGSSGTPIDVYVSGEDVTLPALVADGDSEYLDYSVSYNSWTVGGLYKFSDNTSFFVRGSKGGRFNADRQTMSGKINADGSLTQAGEVAAVDFVNQYEMGVKNRGDVLGGYYTFEMTLLQGDFTQSAYEPTSTPSCPSGGCVLDNEYESQGAEILGSLRVDRLSLIANATFTDAQARAAGGGEWVEAWEIPSLTYTMSANYEVTDELIAGVNMTGQTDTYARGSLDKYEGSTTWGASVRYAPTENLEFSVTGYNILDDFAVRSPGQIINVDESNNTATLFVNPTLGRTITASVKVTFE